MTKYIEREKLINELQCLPEQGELLYLGVYDCVNTTPTADVQEIKHGKWIKMYNNPDDGNYYCSECHNGIDVATGKVTPIDRGLLYCPNCGAKMDGGAIK